jgi:hypothetical protein
MLRHGEVFVGETARAMGSPVDVDGANSLFVTCLEKSPLRFAWALGVLTTVIVG